MTYREAVARDTEVLQPRQPVHDAGQVHQETGENLTTRHKLKFWRASSTADILTGFTYNINYGSPAHLINIIWHVLVYILELYPLDKPVNDSSLILCAEVGKKKIKINML